MADLGAADGQDRCDTATSILLVDGALAPLQRLRTILSPSGYDLLEARSGAEALQALQKAPSVSVILMAAGMPGLDGFETVRLIRQRDALRRIPVIFLIAARQERLLPAVAAAGAVDFMVKPVDPVVLRSKVAVFVDLHRKTTELQYWSRKLEQLVRRRTEEDDEANSHYRSIAENAGDLIAMLDRQGRRVYASPSFLNYFGAEQVAAGSDSFASVHPEDRERIAEVFRQTVATGQGRRAEYRLITRDGEIRHFESEGSPVRDPSGRVRNVVVVSRDITERHQAEELTRRLAYLDPLTGLPNRRMFSECLAQSLAFARRHGQRVALMFVDLDDFKRANDRYGRDVGDAVLCLAAERIRGCLREEDTVARLGGDEFCVQLINARDDTAIAAVAQKIAQVLQVPMVPGGRELCVSASIGVSVYPDDGDSAEALLQRADRAMYQAKTAGGSRHLRYAPAMDLLPPLPQGTIQPDTGRNPDAPSGRTT